MPVGHTADQQTQANPLSVGREESQSRVPLEHRILGRCQRLHLEPVIHHRELGTATLLSCSCRCGDGRADSLRTAGKAETRIVHG